ncbi:MAG: helix-turn-helix domain-containing protein [Candidatus Altiarchaeota archaeon]
MTKAVLSSRVQESLERREYDYVDCAGIQSSFDIIAKSDDSILLVKILYNVEGLTREAAAELKRVSEAISAKPVVIGFKIKSSELQDDVVYERYGIPVINHRTFDKILDDIQPPVYSIRGNYCIKINPERLSHLRRQRRMTQQNLADSLGVSKQSVYRYESTGHVSLDIAERLEQVFSDDRLLLKGDIFENAEESEEAAYPRGYTTELTKKVDTYLRRIGFKTSITNAPFDIIAKERKMIFSAISNDRNGIRKKMTVLNSVSDIMGGYPLCISERRVKIETTILNPADFEGIRTPRQLFRILVE